MGTESMSMTVADAGPLIHLGEIGELTLLELFDEVIIPGKVWEETVQEGRLSADQLALLSPVIRRDVDPADVQTFIRAHNLEHLHAGESECLWLCHRDEVHLLLTDDLAVRDAAASLGITPVGSLGVVVRAFHLGIITLLDAEEAVVALYRTSSLFVTRALVDMVLARLRQEDKTGKR